MYCAFSLTYKKSLLLEQQLSFVSVDLLIVTVLNRELVFQTGEQNVREKEDLCYGERQRHAEVEVGVRRSGVYPLMPHGRSEDRAEQHETAYDKSLLHIYKKEKETDCKLKRPTAIRLREDKCFH